MTANGERDHDSGETCAQGIDEHVGRLARSARDEKLMELIKGGVPARERDRQHRKLYKRETRRRHRANYRTFAAGTRIAARNFANERTAAPDRPRLAQHEKRQHTKDGILGEVGRLADGKAQHLKRLRLTDRIEPVEAEPERRRQNTRNRIT